LDVAAAARLWRAALFNVTGRRDRALALLATPLSPLSPGQLEFDYYSRLYRCRCVADRGGYAAAVALLMEIGRMADEWFVDRQRQDAARHAAMAVRAHVLQAWCDGLADAPTAQREWCLDALAAARAGDDGEPAAVLRLGQAVPLLVTIPEIPDTTPTTPSTQPAATAPSVPAVPPTSAPAALPADDVGW
jgi:hypothetical protein